MAKFPDLATDNPILFLISVHFPDYADHLSAVTGSIRVRANKPLLSAELRATATAYTKELKTLSAEELVARVSDAKEIQEQRRLATLDAEEKARFYNQPRSTADFRHWAKMSYWSPDEITALSLGREPSIVNSEKISSFRNLSQFVREYERRGSIVSRAKVMGQLSPATPPNLVLAWARRMAFEMPAGLVSEVEALGMQIADWKDFHDARVREIGELKAAFSKEREDLNRSRADSLDAHNSYAATAMETIDGYRKLLEDRKSQCETLKDRIFEMENAATTMKTQALGVRERESLLKIIIAMAIKKYRYDPQLMKNSATTNIATSLRELAIPLDEDTIRKYLNEAKVLLPGIVKK